MNSNLTRTIAIVGAGFSGSVTAIRLLARRYPSPTRLVLIEASGDPGPGLAYRHREFPFLLNVPAANMSLDAGAPNDFLDFARQLLPGVDAGDYLPRSMYGDYLRTRLNAAVARRDASLEFECLTATVTGLAARPDAGYRVALADGRTLDAAIVIVANGTPAPTRPVATEALSHDPRYHEDPWAGVGFAAHSTSLLVIGTGLTAVDIISAAHDANPAIRIHAVSRHGLLPLAQARERHSSFDPASLDDELSAHATCRALLRAVREAARSTPDWRDVVIHVRHRLPGLWAQLPERERRQFLRHVRPYWDVHRHRLPPDVHANLETLTARGQLTIHAGRLLAIDATQDNLIARIQPRGGLAKISLAAGAVVNCTGPDYLAGAGRAPLGSSLLAAGLVAPDALRCGWRTGSRGALISHDGQEQRNLYYIGPMLRAAHWESTAVAELRVHAEDLAEQVGTTLEAQPRARERTDHGT